MAFKKEDCSGMDLCIDEVSCIKKYWSLNVDVFCGGRKPRKKLVKGAKANLSFFNFKELIRKDQNDGQYVVLKKTHSPLPN